MATIEELSLIDAEDWLSDPYHGSFSHNSSWSTDLIILETDEELFNKMDVIQCLIDAFGFVHSDAVAGFGHREVQFSSANS